MLLEGFDFLSPVRRLDQTQTSGGVRRALFEHVAAQRIVRVAQPRSFVTERGNPEGAVNRGRLLFGYFFLAKQEKVTCCRATPDGVGFEFEVCSSPSALLRTGSGITCLPAGRWQSQIPLYSPFPCLPVGK